MERKLKEAPRRTSGVRPISLLMLLMAFVVTYVSTVLALTPKSYVLAKGDIAEETITATRDVEDAATTEELRTAARNGVSPIYVVDETLVENNIARTEDYFSGLNGVREQAETMRIDETTAWESALDADQMATLCTLTDPKLTTQQLLAILNASDSELLRLKELVLPKVSTALANGLAEENEQRIQNACAQELNATTLSTGLKEAGTAVISAFVQATYVVDQAATETAQEAAAQAITPLEIKQGQVIVEKGSVVTQAQVDLLRELELIRDSDSDLLLFIGIGVFLALVYLAFGAYLLFYRREVFENSRKMVIIGVVISLTMLLAFLCNAINMHITPGLIAVMLAAILVCDHTAQAVNVLMAVSVGMMAGGRGSSMLQLDSMLMTLSMGLAGFAAVIALRQASRRSTVIAAGLIGGGVAAAALAALYLMLGKPFLTALENCGWALGSDALAGVLCVGTLSIWENVFDVPTAARLSELSNANHPLLRQLMTEAPGTYHHSVMVAAMAEGAAQRVGADPALARVGAYFHDVGKLRRPLYFKENQRQGENIHDTLPPAESAAAIIAHQKDGVVLLNKYKLPSAVIQIAYEHHGNSLMTYFYHKAVQEQDGKSISQKPFRYPGARPTTKESALVMLADSCEAAVRSLPQDASRETVEEMVHKVITGKLEDGQLSQTPLTLLELTEIERSFLKTLSGIRHERIEYPDMKKGC